MQFGSQYSEGSFGGQTPYYVQSSVRVIGDGAITAVGHCLDQQTHVLLFAFLLGETLHLPIELVAMPSHLVARRSLVVVEEDERSSSHIVGGQGACLVTTNNSGTTQSLYTHQSTYNGPMFGHTPGA